MWSRLRPGAWSARGSLLGPLWPGRSRTSATAPAAVNAPAQRHNVDWLTPNADATSVAEAIFVVTNCTAANRRPASSPAP